MSTSPHVALKGILITWVGYLVREPHSNIPPWLDLHELTRTHTFSYNKNEAEFVNSLSGSV